MDALQEKFNESKNQGATNNDAVLFSLEDRAKSLRRLIDTAIDPDTASRAKIRLSELRAVMELLSIAKTQEKKEVA